MQENHKATIGISPMPKILNPQCSCTKCDSVTCFAHRRTDLPCACENCSNGCMINKSSLDISDSKTSSVYFKELQREQARENITKELIKKEILYDFDQNNNAKTINKKESKLIYKTVDSIENILMQDGTDRLNRLHDLVKSSRKEASPSRVKLSAQIMDVSFDEFQKSLSKPNFSSNIANLSPYDIFNKIKEAYKACSCKVCECIVGKSYQTETCKCKPCECSDCVSISRRVRSFTNGEPVRKHDEGCPCIRCHRGSCKGIAKEMRKYNENGKTSQAQYCDCIGVLKYDYLNDTDHLSQSCNCEPCRCIECTLKSIRKQRLVVAPVGEDYQQRNECQCSPCECFSCGHYGLSSNVHHEMSTSVNRHPQCHCETCINEACIPDGNQSCRCERQSKVMSKPFQQDSHDYDIRRVNVTNDNLLRRRYNHDTIAMFAAVPDPYVHKENKQQCDCGPCECIKCNYKDINIEQARACEQFQPIQNYRLRNESKDCECSPCECQICTKRNSNLANFENLTDCSYRHTLTNSSIEVETHVSKKPKSKFLTGNCECHPCECVECEKLMTTCVGDICQCSNCKCENCIKETYSNEVIYPVKKGERMTPSIYKTKIKDAFIESCISNLEANEKILKQHVGFRPSLKKPSAFNPVQESKIRDDYVNRVSHQKCFQENYSNQQAFPRQIIAETVNRAQSSKYANRKKLRSERNEPILEATLSIDSSMSYKESGSITPTRCKVNWESSCNSSGYDYPSYLIHFPETTVETCLNDVMQFDTGNSLTSNNSVSKEHYTDFNMNIQKRSKYQHTNKKNSEEKPAKSMGNKTLRKENIFLKKSFHIEDNPNRLQNIEVQHIKYEHSVNHDSFPKIQENNSVAASNKICNTKNFQPDDDFKRAQNTLQEARAFSQHLVLLLEQYEKANREFESVSEKFKKSNDSLFSKITNITSTADFNGLFERDVPTKDQNLKISSGSSTEELVDINKNTNKRNDFKHSHAVYNNLEIEKKSKENIQLTNEICDDNNEGRDESGDDVIKANNELLKTIFEEKESISIGHKYDKKRVVKRLHKRYSKMYRRPISSKRLKRFTYTSSDAIENDTEAINNLIQGNNNEIIEKICRTFNETDVAEDITGDYESESKSSYDEEGVNNVIKIKKSTTELKVHLLEKDSKEDHTLQKDVVMIKQPVIERSRLIFDIKNDGSSVLKNNNNFNKNSSMNNPRIPLVPPLERSDKAEAKNKSRLQPNENAMYLYENKALMNVHAEVKKLLDLPNLRSLRRTSLGEQKGQQVVSHEKLSKSSFSQTSPGLSVPHSKEGASMTASSSRNICEALKVKFLNVRRVSDHTVLVKWETPRAMDNVKGYELLVDGRAVKKILNPSRCMAVVTCLPHSEKVILTVRTVVSPPCSDRSPAVTVIYQPKVKY